MARLATNQHQDAVIDPDDTVVFSSRAIPGNERAVVDLVGDVLRRGAVVVTRMTNSSVHTSGHATREEQTRMLDLIRPHSFMPVHGTLHHLTRHAALARERGVSDVIIAENGDSVLFDGSTLSREGKVPSGSVPVGLRGVSLDAATLRQRADLARYGIASVAIAVGRKGELLSPPSVIVRGIAGLSEPAALRPIEREIARVVESARKERRRSDSLREELRRIVKKRLLDIGGTRPVVEIHVLETDD
jgi:ribonuclease J